ncbi:MAG TPA: hypothetical protein VGK31_04255 [Thermoanaerobaculia bacterium]
MRRTLSWAGLFFVCATYAAAPKPVPMKPASKAQWQEDVDYFAREIVKRHANAFHAVTREQFAAAIAALKANIATASDDEILVGVMKLAAMIGDGHTGVHLPSNIHQFPITIVRIEGVYRVARAAGSAGPLVGGRLTRVDDTPLDETVTRIHSVLAQDESEVFLTAFTPVWFSIAEVLHGLRITSSAATARFTVTMDDGSEKTANVEAIEMTAKPQWQTAARTIPLYRQRPEEGFSYTWLEDTKTVYVNFRRYDDLRARSRELWSFVDSHPVQRIAVDLRQNGGGDFNVGRKYLVDELARRPKVHPYVIIGPRTFSAALKNAIDFRTVAHATLVGEPIGERPNSYSENDEMRLPHTGLVISYSTKYYKFLPDDGLVTPDQRIEQNWADWLEGRDPVLEWIIKQ